MSKKTVWLIIIVLVVLGAYWLSGRDSRTAPSPESLSPVDTNTMPVPQTDGNTVEEKVVSEESPATQDIKAFTIEEKSFSFTPTTIKVKKGDKVQITLKNVGGFHDLKIDEFNVATKRINANEQEVITFVADKAGSFEYYCSVGEHRVLGMKGTLFVE